MKFEEQQPNTVEIKNPVEMMAIKDAQLDVEKTPNPEEFSREKIADIEKSGQEVQTGGAAEFQRISDEYGASDDIKSKYQGTFETCSQKVKDLTEAARVKMSRLVIGASMLAATSGSMESVAMANTADKSVDNTHIEESVKGGNEKKSAGLSDVEFVGDAETKEKIAQAEKATKQDKEELLNQMSSKEYLEKMTIECDGDESAAKSQVRMRIKNLEKTKIIVETQEDIRKIVVDKINKELKDTLGVLGSEDSAHRSDLEEIAKNSASKAMEIAKGAEFLGYTEKETGVHIAYDASLGTTPRHELSHASTGGINTLPLKTMDLFRDAFKSTPDTEMLDFYFSNADEMLARKKELDKDLERLGIKKYGEPTTDTQLEKIKQSYDKGELSTGSMQLIEHVKKGYLKKILDQVAKSEGEDAFFVG